MPHKRKKRLTAKQKALAKQRREWQQELDEARRQQRMAKAKRQEQSGSSAGRPGRAPQATRVPQGGWSQRGSWAAGPSRAIAEGTSR